jgi:protoporphyrin/coproporphyrin ferrochelatase
MNTKGVLLVNLGSPDSPSVPDVRKYLREFLMDGRVLDTPFPIRFAVVHGAILPKRPQQSAEAYHKVWTPEGSPLVVTSRHVQKKLQSRLTVPIELAMRYQNPSIPSAIEKLRDRGVKELLLIPLFPHYAMSSYETAVMRVEEVIAKLAPDMALDVIPPFYDQPDYIAALAESVKPQLAGGYDHLLFSYHGIPERHLRKADPTKIHCLKLPDCCENPGSALPTCYRAQCFQTTKSLVKAANISPSKYSISFQSRLGRDPWLKPYTDFEIPRLAKDGVKKLAVICPAFVSDCLETIEEIGIRGKELFLEAGGKDLILIPCLNEHPMWIDALEKMVNGFLARPLVKAKSCEKQCCCSH